MKDLTEKQITTVQDLINLLEKYPKDMVIGKWEEERDKWGEPTCEFYIWPVYYGDELETVKENGIQYLVL